MMTKGYRSGKLTAVEFLNTEKIWSEKSELFRYFYIWKCICDCGAIREVRSAYLTSKSIRSCGSEKCRVKRFKVEGVK